MKVNAFYFSIATIIAGSAAQAGGYIAPVVEIAEPIVAEEAAPLWQGGYVGGSLGYAFQGEDVVGLHETATATSADRFLGDVGELKLKGVNGSLRAGYGWQRNDWVFGPELGFDFGSIEDSVSGRLAPRGYVPTDVEAESKIKNVISLTGKLGYVVRPDVLLFGKAGVARADIEYRLSGADESGETYSGNSDYKKTGYIVGFGAEKRINEKFTVTGEYEYANFGKETREFQGIHTEATPKYNNIKVGLNYRF